MQLKHELRSTALHISYSAPDGTHKAGASFPAQRKICPVSRCLTASEFGRSGDGMDMAERLPPAHPGAAPAADQRLKADPPLSALVAASCIPLGLLLGSPSAPPPNSRRSRLLRLTLPSPPPPETAETMPNTDAGAPLGTGTTSAPAAAAFPQLLVLQGRARALRALAREKLLASSQLLALLPLPPLPSPPLSMPIPPLLTPLLRWPPETVAVSAPRRGHGQLCCRVSSAAAACDNRCRPSDSPLLVGCGSVAEVCWKPAE